MEEKRCAYKTKVIILPCFIFSFIQMEKNSNQRRLSILLDGLF